jgi:hypothetical protein
VLIAIYLLVSSESNSRMSHLEPAIGWVYGG